MDIESAPRNTGWIEVICGPMFSGKTETLIGRLQRAHYERRHIQVFKPSMDTRYAEIDIVSHSRQSLAAVPVDQPEDIYAHLEVDTEVVGIDEGNFFDISLVDVVQDLADRGLRVIVAGLELDFRGDLFEPIPRLMAVAEYVTKKRAVCVRCGNPAGRSFRLAGSENQQRIVLGADDAYEARCRRCFNEGQSSSDEDATLLDETALC